jgi:hypothetical protein
LADQTPEPSAEFAPDLSATSDADSIFTRGGHPGEFDDDLTGEIFDPDEPGPLDVPPGLLRRVLADPVHAPELLAGRAVSQLADLAQRDLRLLRERNPNATDRQLAVYFKRKYSRAARWEGAGHRHRRTAWVAADLGLLAWVQNKLVLSIAATYGHDTPTTPSVLLSCLTLGRPACRLGRGPAVLPRAGPDRLLRWGARGGCPARWARWFVEHRSWALR